MLFRSPIRPRKASSPGQHLSDYLIHIIRLREVHRYRCNEYSAGRIHDRVACLPQRAPFCRCRARHFSWPLLTPSLASSFRPPSVIPANFPHYFMRATHLTRSTQRQSRRTHSQKNRDILSMTITTTLDDERLGLASHWLMALGIHLMRHPQPHNLVFP